MIADLLAQEVDAIVSPANARADEEGLATIALPAISTGIFGYPLDLAAPVAVGAVREAAAASRVVTLVRFCFLEDGARAVYAAA